MAALLGATWPLRATILLEEGPEERDRLHRELAALAAGGDAGGTATHAVRRALVEVLRCHDRPSLQDALDRALLGSGSGRPLRAAVS
jgi:hypothetical protein